MNLAATAGNLGWLTASAPSAWRFERALQRPEETQWRLLRRQLKRNASSAYGREYGFGEIRSYAEFARRMPLVGYEEILPWVGRIRDGEAGVLTSEPVTRLMPTSGSSGARKLIPFTAGLQREFNAAIGPWMVDLAGRHRGIVGGRAYWSVTPLTRNARDEVSAVPVGFEDDAGYLGGVRQRLVERIMAAPSTLRHIEEVGRFRYSVLLCLLRCADLRLISVWHPSFLTLLLGELPARWEELLADVKSGGCRYNAHSGAALHAAPMPARAAQLKRLDPRKAGELWRELRVISCWADGHAALAVDDLRQRFPGVAIQPKGLLATEAFVTFPFAGSYPVAVRSHVFEFIDEAGDVLPVHALRPGSTYEVAVTTSGGLWRYRLGDRVVVTGFAGATPALGFAGRGRDVSDLCGEKLSEPFVASVLAKIFAGQTARVRFALLAPEKESGVWGYTLFVEGEISAEVGESLERALCDNPHYAYCRELGQLRATRCFKIAGQGYETFAATEMEAGRRLGDIKPVALSQRTDWRARFSTRPSCNG